MGASILLSGVGKRYPVARHAAPSSLKESALSGFRHWRRREWHWALRDVDLEIAPGTSLGLIGPNGAGKSSLLRLIGGIGRPSEGRVHVTGRVGALLELGTGFHGDLSGRESAVLAMMIAGCTRRDATTRLPEVTEFAGLQGRLDQPLRTYSSGMAARLAFAVATSVEPDLLLVDEVLAVGDLAFQQRCLRRIEQFNAAGVTVIVVSHDPALVAHTCEEVAWFQGGRLIAHGATAAVLGRYVQENAEAARAATPAGLGLTQTADGIPLVPGENRVGSQAAVVESVRLLDRWGASTDVIPSGAGLVVEVDVAVPADTGAAQLGVRIVRRSDGTLSVDTSTTVDPEDGLVRVEIERLDLAPGAYDVDVGLFDPAWATTYDHHSRAYPLQVTGDGPHGAVLAPPLRWQSTSSQGAGSGRSPGRARGGRDWC